MREDHLISNSNRFGYFFRWYQFNRDNVQRGRDFGNHGALGQFLFVRTNLSGVTITSKLGQNLVLFD